MATEIDDITMCVIMEITFRIVPARIALTCGFLATRGADSCVKQPGKAGLNGLGERD